MTTFSGFPDTVFNATLSGSNGIQIGLLTGTPNKITASLAGPLYVSGSNVGIGTSTPSASLHLQSTGPVQLILEADTDNINEADTANILFKQDGGRVQTQVGMFQSGTDAGNDFRIANSGSGNDVDVWFGAGNGTEKMRIKANGNVGIGTTSPDAALDIEKTPNNFLLDLTNANENAFKIRTYNSGTSVSNGISFINGLFYNNTENSAIRFYRGISSNDGFMSISTAGTERMLINSAGNVGIGGTPSHPLHINKGTGAASGNEIMCLQGQDVWHSYRDGSGTRTAWTGFGASANTNIFSITNEKNSGQINIDGTTGRIGINTATPQTTLSVAGGTSLVNGISINNGDVHTIITNEPSSNDGKIQVTKNGSATSIGATPFDLRLNPEGGNISTGNGNFGIGTTPSYTFHVSGGNVSEIARFENNTSQNDCFIRVRESSTEDVVLGSTAGTGFVGSSTNNSFAIKTYNTNRVTVDNSGKVGIGTAGPAELLHVNGGNIRNSALSGVGYRAVYSDASGILTNTASDLTLKENIENLSYGINEILLMNPISYTWKDKERSGTQKEIGFGAQDIQKIIPEVIGNNSDGTLSLDYSKLVAVLTNGIKQLKQENDLLKSKLDEILERLIKLENK